ncbi:hypothetical protein KSP40_PGU012296 [Platanthera guangdongensis]|uniref:Uncharacterized protein n=1 Tax=Platanthera guangdongensis TaxID=2320717 RepID=A0ABR2MCG9_9ASPA
MNPLLPFTAACRRLALDAYEGSHRSLSALRLCDVRRPRHPLHHRPTQHRQTQLCTLQHLPTHSFARRGRMDPTVLVGEVIYNAFFPFRHPDIVFSPEDEEFRPLLPAIDGEGEDESQARLMRSSLWNWNSKDPSMLFNLVVFVPLYLVLFNLVELE